MTAQVLSDRSPQARLTEISRALTYARSLDEVLQLTVECAADLLGAPKAVLMLSGGDHFLRIRASWGVEQEVVARFSEPLDEHLLSHLEGVLGPRLQERFLGVPLVTRAEVIGLLAVRLPEAARAADPTAERLLSALADQASVAIEGARDRELRDRLEVKVGDLERHHSSQDQAILFLSHDIRTAIGSIDGYSALLSGGVMGEVTDRQKEALERIRQVGGHLLSLLGNVMEVARLRTEGVTFSTTTLALGGVVKDATNVVMPSAQEANIRIAVKEGPPIEVMADRHRLRQVLVQLLDNAVKYSPDGSTVTVTTGVVSDGDRFWGEVVVSDQGPGIAEDHLVKIFQAYERVRGSAPDGKSVSGLGLGLSIAQGMVERMGGTISVQSDVGRGSSFMVRIPLAPLPST